jgi:hypothetical protein
MAAEAFDGDFGAGMAFEALGGGHVRFLRSMQSGEDVNAVRSCDKRLNLHDSM